MLRPFVFSLLIVTLLIPAVAVAAPSGPPSFTDVPADHPFFEEIEWLAESGITKGCDQEGTLFCPDDPVTRGQMASFLVRAFDLPSTTTDYFNDDDGTIHEADANALREAKVTLGCNAEQTAFCPAEIVTREQMASFMARAIPLTPIFGDIFSDVSGIHEPNVNALYDAGITKGCNAEGTNFCPAAPVTRAEMAAFLYRAIVTHPQL